MLLISDENHLDSEFFFMQEILRLYEMSENNERKRISWAIHKRNKNKMMRYRQLCSNDEEFLSFKDGFLEQVPPSQQQINQRDLPGTSSCNTNVNFQVDGQADHDALNRDDGCEGYATDSSEEFRTAEEIEHCNYYNPERFDDYEYENCGHSEYESEKNGSKNTYTLNHCFQRLRLRDEMLEDMKTAFLSKVTTNGVKGIPSLISLPEFDIRRSQQRQPVANECEYLRELDIQPPEELLSFFQVKVNKIKYKCDDNEDTKFCNSYIFSKMYGFGKIISIVEFTSLNENTVRGFFIKCLQKKKEMFDTNYIVKIEETKTIKFLSADEDIKPAIIVSTVNGMHSSLLIVGKRINNVFIVIYQ
ncbi:hypothetical protein KQX54_005724 [Cotesia glomerata]|uniref:Uncharacterized protein n=1 Tax=Cotesia glomerata TaxID=32391 RepID=A0AAV7J461_COTGL|nr:hypothetical protein KQX54_005724 [Cotesia glomerata]